MGITGRLRLVTVSVTDFGTNSGLWTLRVDEDAVNNAEAILGRPAKFDHLAIVLKGASGLAIYDFNFLDIFSREALDGNNVFNFETPYTLSGSWDTSELINSGENESALSHFSMWVRDPIIANEVPAPQFLWLLLLISGGMLLGRRKAN